MYSIPIFYTLADLLYIVSRLRDPVSGCPWDIRQTHQSLSEYLLEESYEIIDAINLNDSEGLKEELGDVLFQLVLHSQIAHEHRHFDLADVIHAICEKMMRRHPHVFNNDAEDQLSEVEVQAQWQQIKQSEGKNTATSTVSAVKSSRPALNVAHDLGKEAAKYGFDWPDTATVLAKITEEIAEIRDADAETLQEEIGDLMFASVQLCRKAGVDPEQTLRAASHKFRTRFEAMVDFDPELPKNSDAWEARWQLIKKQN